MAAPRESHSRRDPGALSPTDPREFVVAVNVELKQYLVLRLLPLKYHKIQQSGPAHQITKALHAFHSRRRQPLTLS